LSDVKTFVTSNENSDRTLFSN